MKAEKTGSTVVANAPSMSTTSRHEQLKQDDPEMYAFLVRLKKHGLKPHFPRKPRTVRIVGYSDTGLGTRFLVGIEEDPNPV